MCRNYRSHDDFLDLLVFFLTFSTAFDIFILATIIANCVVLALDAPLPNNDKSAISDELVSIMVTEVCNE